MIILDMLTNLIVNALAFYITAYLVPGVKIADLLVLVVVAVVWGGLLAGFLLLTRSATTLPATEPEPEAEVAVVAPSPTITPTSEPTATPLPTAIPSPLPPATSESIAASPTDPPAVPEPSPAPTDTPAPEPTPTEARPANTPAPVEESDQVSYRQDVLPILERRCIKCHGGTRDDGSVRIEEGLDLRTYASLLAGSFNGAVIEPGNAEASYLVELINEGEMPKNEPRLLPAEIRAITDWVQAGAADN